MRIVLSETNFSLQFCR